MFDCISCSLSDAERTSAPSSPLDEPSAVFMNGAESGVVNGHVPRRKRYIESSLDELAMEIEAYEQSDEEKPKRVGYSGRAKETDEEPEPHREPVIVAVPQAGPSRDSEQKEEEEEMTIAEMLKLTEEVHLLNNC